MKNIHVLPTDNPSTLYYLGKELKLRYVKDLPVDSDIAVNQYIYITSNEEIKEGDYMLLKYEHSHGRIRKCHYIYEEQLMIDAKEDIGFGFCKRNEVYKITLTTDQDLIKDGVQSIDDEFLEWFVMNPSCEFVEIKPLLSNNGRALFGYKIIIPKEEPKQEFLKQKRMSGAKTVSRILEESKQETLEEAYNRIFEYKLDRVLKAGFIADAKWQQERMYSEEDIKEAFSDGWMLRDGALPFPKAKKEWFEQFKKK